MGVRGLGLVLYGGEGMGKTGLSLQFSHLGPLKCLSIGETGYEDLNTIGEVPDNCTNVVVDSWDEMIKETRNLEEQVLVLDGLAGVQKMLFNHVCRTMYDNNWTDFTSYWKGQRVDSPAFLSEYLNMLDNLRAEGKHIILIGHMVTTQEPNTLGADYLSHVIALDDGDKGGLRSCVKQWAQAILFLNIDISITRATETARNKVVMEGKAKDDDNRLIYTTKAPGHSAKNRLQLPPIISMGASANEAFVNLWKVMPKVYKDLM